MKLIPILIGMMFLLSGLAIFANAPNVSATTTYYANSYDSGIGTLFGTGSISSDQAFSGGNSLKLAQYQYEYDLFNGTTEFACSFYVYPTSYGLADSTIINFYKSTAPTGYSCWLNVGTDGKLYTIDFDHAQARNYTGFTLPLNTWSHIVFNITDGGKYIALQMNGGAFTGKMWNQINYKVCDWLGEGTTSGSATYYFDDMMVSSIPVVTPPNPNTIIDGRVSNQWRNVSLLQPSFPTYYIGTPFITWKNAEYGKVATPRLPFQVQSTSAIFRPGYDQQVRMNLQLEIYDNDTLFYLYDWPMVISDSNATHDYLFANGNISLATYESNGTGYTNEFINLDIESGHTYYFVYDMRITSMNGTPMATTTFSGVMSTPGPVNNQQSWVNGIIWIMIIFTPVWLLNWFFPRYGFLLGMAIMAIMLGITEPGFYYVSVITLATIGLMAYTVSKGD